MQTKIRVSIASCLLAASVSILACAGEGPINVRADQSVPSPDWGAVDLGPLDGAAPVVDTAPPPDGTAPPDAAPPTETAPPPDTQPPPVAFTDVPSDHLFYAAIQWVAQQGIMKGCQSTPPAFCPDDPLLRDQLAVTVIRMKFGQTFTHETTPFFVDVPATHWAFKYIQKLRSEGITKGCNPPANDQFCPDDPTTRAQAAVFLIRAKFGDSFAYPNAPYFTDVPDTHWAFKFVQKLRDEDITKGCNSPANDQFCPDDEVSRAQWAAFLYRAKTL